MKKYEFLFGDGTSFIGEGTGEAEAFYDAYVRNGYIPTSGLVGCVLLHDSEIQPAPPVPPQDIDPGMDISTGKKPDYRKGKK